jgi:uncharacterized protein
MPRGQDRCNAWGEIEHTDLAPEYERNSVMATVTSNGSVTVHRSPIDWIAGALVIIGALNWGLVGLAHFDLVASILGSESPGARIVYVLVGLAGIFMLVRAFTTMRPHSLSRH